MLCADIRLLSDNPSNRFCDFAVIGFVSCAKTHNIVGY